MDVINQTVPQALLADPSTAITSNNAALQLYAYNTNNTSVTNTSGANNNATVLGYKDNTTGLFRAVYTIGRLTSADLQTAATANPTVSGNLSNLSLKALGGTFNASGATAGPANQYGGSSSPVKSAKVDNNVVTLELNPQAFDKDDRVILNAGFIDGRYDDKINRVLLSTLKPAFPSGGSDFVKVTDPAGRPLDSGNSSTSANIDINNSQRVATAN